MTSTKEFARKLIKVSKPMYNIFPIGTDRENVEYVCEGKFKSDIFYFRKAKRSGKLRPITYIGFPMFAVITN